MSVLNVGTLNATGGVKLPNYAAGNFPTVGLQVGQIIYDTTGQEIKLWNGSSWVGLYPQFYADILVVGGGGGGGGSFGGGGGGGGVIYKTGFPMTSGMSWSVRVGVGASGSPPNTDQGTVADNGGWSRFGHFYADGGGGGSSRHCYDSQCRWGQPAGNGGCGGGGSHVNVAPKGIPGSGLPGQGFNGGWGAPNTSGTPNHASGGGGGAGQPGGDWCSGSSGGKGGDGYLCDISGSPVRYAAGGGGGVYTNGAGGNGGAGGGGTGGRYNQSGQLTNGTSATGYGSGGGGGGYRYSGGNGSNGIVIVRYPGGQRATGGTVATSGGYTTHTFTNTGNDTFTVN